MKIYNLYSTPIYTSPVDNYQKIQEELQVIYDESTFTMREDWGHTHYLSDESFMGNVFDDPRVGTFEAEIHKHVQRYLNEIGYTKSVNFRENIYYRISTSWFAKFEAGCYAHIHNHGHADISGAYYFKMPEGASEFFITSPTPQFDPSFLFHHLGFRTNFAPPQGSLMMMPGFINHGVKMNETEEDRVSLAFNIVFERPEIAQSQRQKPTSGY